MILFFFISCIDWSFKITDILTFATVLLAILTLRQVIKQRESMYIPDLFLGEKYTSLIGFDLNKEISFFEYESINKSKNGKSEKEKDIFLYLNIYNIGFGAAKYVKCEWDYDSKKMLMLLKSYFDYDRFDIYERNNKDEEYISITHKESKHFSSFSKEKMEHLDLDVVLHNEIENATNIVFIPQMYIELLNYYIILKYKMFDINSSESFIFEELDEFPILSLKLTYFDIRNKKYIKNIILSFKAMIDTVDNEKRKNFGNYKLWYYKINIKEQN